MVLRDKSYSKSISSRGGEFRSKVGLFAMASMPPELTSMTTIDADLAENSVAAAVTALSAKP